MFKNLKKGEILKKVIDILTKFITALFLQHFRRRIKPDKGFLSYQWNWPYE